MLKHGLQLTRPCLTCTDVRPLQTREHGGQVFGDKVRYEQEQSTPITKIHLQLFHTHRPLRVAQHSPPQGFRKHTR